MRPSFSLLLVVVTLAVSAVPLSRLIQADSARESASLGTLQILTAEFGLSDICLSTEARYLRHLVASDPVSVFMDHPGDLDHFPSTLFWAPRPPTP